MTPPDWLRTPIAHRGLHDANRSIPENSLAAFAAAADAGLPIELDVRLSADGAVVVHHDTTLRRLCDVPLAVARATLAELRSHPLAGTDEVTPTLTEVLDLVAGRVGVVVELKPVARGGSQLCAGVAEVLAACGRPTTVHSFDPRLVRWFARHAPDVVRGQAAGADEPPALVRRYLDAMVARRDVDYVVYSLARITDPGVAALRARGVPVLAYTVRTGTDMARARAHADGAFVESWDRDDPVPDVPPPPGLR
jgi:glycerophosphoryl diester phosphodiesterase